MKYSSFKILQSSNQNCLAMYNIIILYKYNTQHWMEEILSTDVCVSGASIFDDQMETLFYISNCVFDSSPTN